MATWDLFVSYRWMDPDQTWVRMELIPKLRAAGLRVLVDVAADGFVPGRDVICEMARAARESRRTLSVWTPRYFAEDRTVWFESLQARRRDPQGRHSALVPLLLCPATIPEEFLGLVPVDWTGSMQIAEEWIRLLNVLGARVRNVAPPALCDCGRPSDSHEPSVGPAIAQRRILSELSAQLQNPDPQKRYWTYVALGLTGGSSADELLKRASTIETEEFAQLGIQDALELLKDPTNAQR